MGQIFKRTFDSIAAPTFVAMNIGILCHPTYGGSGVVATELGMYLASKGHKVHFITYAQPVRLDILAENIYYHEVKVHEYPLFEFPPYELALTTKVVQTALKWKLDVIHAHYAIPHAYAAINARRILREHGVHLPVITTLHGTDITIVGRNPAYHAAVTYSINQSDIVTAVSQNLKEESFQHFNITKEIVVVPNFVNFEEFRKEIPCIKKQFAPDGQKIISHISNMRPVKRLFDVVKIFAKIRQQMPVRLLMVGDGPEKEPARALARDLGVADDVIFVGNAVDIYRVLKCTDVLLLPSEKESFGLVALEAMAAGKPVISTNTGGLPEVNIDGVTGYLANVGDVDKMAHYATALLTDAVLYEKIQAGALANARKFNIENIAPIYLDLYKESMMPA